MLIQALCEYYDILSKAGKVLPEGYSKVKIHYLISLTPDGVIDNIIDCRTKDKENNKKKEKFLPVDVQMPERTEKTSIDANIIEHRPIYIFGLNKDKKEGTFSADDKTDKARKSHKDFVEKNLQFTDGLDSPLINAFRNFLKKWDPEKETENEILMGLGNEYDKSGYAFCLSGKPDEPLLHEERAIKEKWDEEYNMKGQIQEETVCSQCAVTGKETSIARIHGKIKGVYGGNATGNVLISFKNPSESSYGNEQSYNSNISEEAMKKYTEAFNYLLSGNKHKIALDDMTIVFWAMAKEEKCEDLFMSMLLGTSDKMDAERTEQMFRKILKRGKEGVVSEYDLNSVEYIDGNVDFYMVGIKPNSSRLSVKFVIRKKYADVLWNIARFQKDLQLTPELHPVYLSRIKKELVSPKSSNDKVNPALLTKLFEAIIYGTAYPTALLQNMVRRVRIDSGEEKINLVRVGVIKACINRNYKKEEIKVALDKENKTQAYLCGRLFAVLEKLQQEASNNSLNRTIKDAYFSSASVNPQMIFPKLIRLAQNHMNKVTYPGFYNKKIGEIIYSLNGGFPGTFSLKEQGEFIVGYYQQYQSFFKKSEDKKEMEEE
ncbi:MAG: type I-C CRISPR-associated protein Cas8c/Csd1 [Anaerobutyricum sp.]|nr:type I-C CRISPR-associated protein Cas8c/Csd1 [Anaerobutyricum sp.]